MHTELQQRAADRLAITYMIIGLAVTLEMLALDFIRMPNVVDLFLLIANPIVVIFMGREVVRAFRKMRQASNPTLFATYQIAGGFALGSAMFSFIIVAVLAYYLPIIMSRF